MAASFNIVDSDMLFPDMVRRWETSHDIGMLHYTRDLLSLHQSLWHTRYGTLYNKMCDYFGSDKYDSPPEPTKDMKYIIVIYKRYET